MTEFEYKTLQSELKAKLKNSWYPTKWEDGYNEGILAAKSKIKEIYTREISKDTRK